VSRLTRGHIIALPVRGYHPLRPCFPDRFRLSLMCHWPGPLSLATTSGVSVDVLSSRYLDVSVPWVCLKPLILFGDLIPSLDNRKSKTSQVSVPIISGRTPKPKVLEFRLSKVGCPIRKSADQSFFAAPHGLSQRSTSFIASQRQGIHRTPLRHLIALIINVHTLGRMHAALLSRGELRGRTLTRKTSLLRKIEPMARRSGFANRIIYNSHFVSRRKRAPK
jgi:hypothetical protein